MDDAANSAEKILARWAGTLPHHPYIDFARRLSITSAAEAPTFVLRLMTLYDVRTPQTPCTLPFKTDAPPPATDVWSLKVNLKNDFIWEETQAVVPLSATPETCALCSGSGKRPCKTCNGSKKMPCPDCLGPARRLCSECEGKGKLACVFCKGTGQVASSRDHTTPCQNCAGSGGPVCPTCEGKPLDCAQCKNTREAPCTVCKLKGEGPCADCGGDGQTLKARNYQIEYQPLLERRVCSDPQTPPGLLPAEYPSEAPSPVFAEAENDKIPALQDQLPRADVRAALDALLERSSAAAKEFTGEARVIRRRMTVEKIPVYSVAYEFEGKKYSCWAGSLGGKVVAAATPFTDLSELWAKEALERAAQRDFARAEDLLKNASELAPGPWLDGLKEKIDAIRATRRPLNLPLLFGLAAMLVATGALAATHRLSHHLLWPCVGYLAACAAGLLASWLLVAPRLGARGASAASAAATAGIFFLFSAINPFLRLDAAELQRLLHGRFGDDIPAILSEDDDYYLASLIEAYQPLGVDTQALSDALEANRRRIAAENARRTELKRQEDERLRQEQLARELRRRRAAEAIAAEEAAEAKARAAAAAKAKTKKKKKKKPASN